VPGPQGTLFFFLLVLAFGGFVTWLALTKHVTVRVLAAFLAFIPASVFGIAVVNRYYDYYQTWGALFSDVTGSGAQSVPELAQAGRPTRPGTLGLAITESANTELSAQTGYLFRATVTGHTSHLTRDVYVYLPPQYFQLAYRHFRFPAIELLHGSPGAPESWINVMDVIPIYLKLLAARQASPAVLVMPDTNGGAHYSLQCLNIPPHGPLDMTFIGTEVPDWASRNLRVMPPGPAWGIAGYSEGGYCAANIGLQDARRFGFAAIMSGYFAPSNSHVPAGGRPGLPPSTSTTCSRGTPGWRPSTRRRRTSSGSRSGSRCRPCGWRWGAATGPTWRRRGPSSSTPCSASPTSRSWSSRAAAIRRQCGGPPSRRC
jgi:hypothetical protein